MASDGLPAALAAWIAAEVGPVAGVFDRSWDHGESDVRELHPARGARVFLKVHRQPGKFERERFAYEHWCPHVKSTPALKAVHGTLPYALLLGAVPGAPLEPENEPQADEAYRAAGSWLSRLHSLPFDDRDPIPLHVALVQRFDTWERRASGSIGTRDLGRARSLIAAPRGSARTATPARVPCHRDYSPRNWLWSAGSLQVIDFEHARPDWHLVDLERVHASIPTARPELRVAFYGGYGRGLSAEESRDLARIRVMSAIARIVWAVEHADAAFEAAGRRELAAALEA